MVVEYSDQDQEIIALNLNKKLKHLATKSALHIKLKKRVLLILEDLH